MKSIIQYMFCILVLFSGCTTSAVRHTIYQQQIDQKQEKLNDDAKDLLVKATEMLSVNGGTIDIKRIERLLKKSQSLLNVDVDDGKELTNLNGEALDKKVDEIIANDEKEKLDIIDLKKKDDEVVSKMIADNIEAEAIRKYERSKTIKLYAICGTILSVLGVCFYLNPSKFLSIGSSIIGVFFRK